jgi:3-hydroxyisobutyrate dehydrogenase-like beta-hydroxyacid dehydrogenase
MPMSPVTVIGLGLMGAALARAVMRAGCRTTVWNRTPERIRPLAAEGAASADSLSAAVRASPIVLVCVSDYNAAGALLTSADVINALNGRTLVQLSTGTPQEARTSEAFFNHHGAFYLDGAILGGPKGIGTPDATLLFAGASAAFLQCEPVLKALGGGTRYLGENIGSAAALDLAWLCQRYGLFLGMAHGALICDSERVGIDLFAALFPAGDRARMFAEVIHSKDYGRPTATLAAWFGGLKRVCEQARDARIDSEFPEFAARLFERASRAGYGPEDVAALFKILRGDQSA